MGSTAANISRPKMKLHVIWKIVSSDVTQWRSCIVGNVGTRFWKRIRLSVLHSFTEVGLIVESLKDKNQYSRTRDHPLISTHSTSSITQNTAEPLSDITVDMLLPLKPQKALCYSLL